MDNAIEEAMSWKRMMLHMHITLTSYVSFSIEPLACHGSKQLSSLTPLANGANTIVASTIWQQYVELLQFFLEANAVTDPGKERVTFLSVMSLTTFQLLRSLIVPESPTKSLEDLIEVLRSHYNPVPSEIVECYTFHTRVRRPGETVSTFLSELRALSAKRCTSDIISSSKGHRRALVSGTVQQSAVAEHASNEMHTLIGRRLRLYTATPTTTRGVPWRLGISGQNPTQ